MGRSLRGSLTGVAAFAGFQVAILIENCRAAARAAPRARRMRDKEPAGAVSFSRALFFLASDASCPSSPGPAAELGSRFALPVRRPRRDQFRSKLGGRFLLLGVTRRVFGKLRAPSATRVCLTSRRNLVYGDALGLAGTQTSQLRFAGGHLMTTSRCAQLAVLADLDCKRVCACALRSRSVLRPGALLVAVGAAPALRFACLRLGWSP